MERACPRCSTIAQPHDTFCATCGATLPGDNGAAQETVKPASQARAGSAGGDKRTRRGRWYKRKLLLIPLLAFILIGALIGGAIFYVYEQFDTINSLSTPAPAISGDQLGSDEDKVVDTGPAQEAVRQAQQEDEAPTSSGTEEPTSRLPESKPMVSSSNGKAFMSFTLQETSTAVPESPGEAVPTVGPGTPIPETIQLPPSDTGDTINVLLMGVDARSGEAIDVEVRTDTIVVLNLDPDSGSCRILAIPRDSRVDLPGYGPSKINHALAIGGVPYQMLVVENLLGIELDHYGLVDFTGVQKLVDSLGGITVDNESAFTHEGHEFPEGEIRLNGEEALAYVRFRGDEEGDFGRQERQQLVVRAMLAEGADLNVTTAIPRLLESVEDHVRTDASPTRLVDLGREYHSTCTAETLVAKRVLGEVATAEDAVLKEPLSFVLLEEEEIADKVDWLLTGAETAPATPEASPAATQEDSGDGQ